MIARFSMHPDAIARLSMQAQLEPAENEPENPPGEGASPTAATNNRHDE